VSTPKGTDDEAIGRPGPWSETRYEKPGSPVDRTVDDPADKPEAKPPSAPSKPVTESDYTGKGK
jgi:hypothetical protein